ncbi:MAG TPA: hypothetical protein VFG93_03920 [Gaiellaceae bacterium]|jgi:hypothetical protein|nr:hypothetical protein [Gaiellaceae bacterium]
MAARTAALAAALLIAAVDVVYVVARHHGETADVAVLATALAVAAVLAGAAPFMRRRSAFLGASFAIVLVVAALTGLTIGPLLVPPLLLLLYAALR